MSDLLLVLATNLPAHAAPRASPILVRTVQRALRDASDHYRHLPSERAATLRADARAFLLDPQAGGLFLCLIGISHGWLVNQLKSTYPWAVAESSGPPKRQRRREQRWPLLSLNRAATPRG